MDMRKILFFFARILFVAVCVFTLCAAPFFNKSKAESKDYSLEIWQVDCFEGGTGSRRAYLQSVAKKFCNIKNAKLGAGNNGYGGKVTASVKSHTIYSAEESFAAGIFPDVISFGAGLELPYSRLVKLDFDGGAACEYGKESYAAVWARGGYCLITKKGEMQINKLIIGEQKYNLPLLACRLSNLKMPETVEELPSDKCFYEFNSSKNCGWVATQRDLYRVDGKIEVDVQPLNGYNDLYQCAAVLSCENGNEKAACEFLKFLCSGDYSNPSVIGMLSPNGFAKDESAPISRLSGQNADYCLNVFTSRAGIERLKTQCADFDLNAQNIKNALKYLK